MQNWKIKRMSYKRLGEWLEAIDGVLGIYEDRAMLTLCPFCEISGLDRENCNTCLWYIIEGFGCNSFANSFGFRSALVARRKKKWHKARIPMLRRWKKILQAERDSRTEGG